MTGIETDVEKLELMKYNLKKLIELSSTDGIFYMYGFRLLHKNDSEGSSCTYIKTSFGNLGFNIGENYNIIRSWLHDDYNHVAKKMKMLGIPNADNYTFEKHLNLFIQYITSDSVKRQKVIDEIRLFGEDNND